MNSIENDSPLWIGFLCGSEIPINLTFNKEKTWGQPGKNVSPTPLKKPKKLDTLVLIYVFKTNLFNFFFFLKRNYDTRPKKKKPHFTYKTRDNLPPKIWIWFSF